jgi:hypothetical protein
MKTHDDKAIENFVNKVMQNTVLESPAVDFTSQVMSQVEIFQSREITAYKPLISKRIWSVIGFAILATCFYLFLNTPSIETSWLNSFNFDGITNNSITQALSSFTISKTLTYTIGFLAFMICVQVTFLKHHFDKRFES